MIDRKEGRNTKRRILKNCTVNTSPASILSFLKLSRNESVSEELTQETFFQAYLSIHRFKGESDVFTWLASIAKHVYFKYMKKQKMSVEDSYVGLMTCAYLENSDPESEL